MTERIRMCVCGCVYTVYVRPNNNFISVKY